MIIAPPMRTYLESWNRYQPNPDIIIMIPEISHAFTKRTDMALMFETPKSHMLPLLHCHSVSTARQMSTETTITATPAMPIHAYGATPYLLRSMTSHSPELVLLPLDFEIFLEGHLLVLVEVGLLQFLDR